VTTTITVTTKRQVVLPKAMCERKRIRAGTSLRITEVGEGFYVTPVPEPTEAELAAVFKALDAGRRPRPITAEDEAVIHDEITKYRAEKRRRKA
jgi:bifunctional DNA-binding transcriptional regulator/antitoxin component of YhaV-PrlF toxin-antitoxin module